MMKLNMVILVIVFFVQSIVFGSVTVVKDSFDNWSLLLNGKSFLIQGINYDESVVCEGPPDWKKIDKNNNSILDGPYEAWVDVNENNTQDSGETNIGDFALMSKMGANCIRDYLDGNSSDYANWKSVYTDLYQNYHIMIMMGNFLGSYGVGSAPYSPSYTNDDAKKRMMESVTNMVLAYKDEPYILLWVLGNENNYSFTGTDASDHPVEYAKFINQVSQRIHQLDPNHPVAFCNGDIGFIDIYATYTTDVDIFSANVYRGNNGFGALWTDVKTKYGKPFFITEYGGPWEDAWSGGTLKPSFPMDQLKWHTNAWREIYNNSAWGNGAGNSLGGIVVHWVDRWWEHDGWCTQDAGDNGGICGQGDGSQSPYLRTLRPVYYYYQRVWTNSHLPPTASISIGGLEYVSAGNLSINVSVYGTTNVIVDDLKIINPLSATVGLSYNGSNGHYNTTIMFSSTNTNGIYNILFEWTYDVTNHKTNTLNFTLDTYKPTIPLNLTASYSSDYVSLNWTSSTDNFGVNSYIIYRSTDGAHFFVIGTTQQTKFIDKTVDANMTYYYKIRSKDFAENQSDYSEDVTIKTITLRVEVYPVPVNFSKENLTIQFQNSTTEKVGINIYNISGSKIQQICASQFFEPGIHIFRWKNIQNIKPGLY